MLDDIDGVAIEDGKGETIKFAVDGVSYEIDLSDKNAKKFRDAVDVFVASARKSGRSTGTRSPGARPSNKEELAAIRVWARENGLEVSDRGRISAEIQEAYRASK